MSYSQPSQTSKIELFAFYYFCKIFILDVWLDSECASLVLMKTKNSSENLKLEVFRKIVIKASS